MNEPLFLSVTMPEVPLLGAGDVERRIATAIADVLPDAVGLSAQHIASTLASVLLGHSAVLNLRPTLTEPDRDAARSLLEHVVRISGRLEADRREAAIESLAAVLLPDRLAEARGLLAADNLEFRDRFLAEVPAFTGAQVGEQAGQASKNPYATAARWKRAGSIFSVAHRGSEWFPCFQFRDGRPHPTIKKVLATLPTQFSPWQRAAWFTSTNGWLDDDLPSERLEDADRVMAAAAHELQDLIG